MKLHARIAPPALLAVSMATAVALTSGVSAVDEKPPRLVARARLDAPPSLGAHGLSRGSIFSDLFRDRRDPPGVFWSVTDRGPNSEVLRDGALRRTFAYAGFSPAILKVRVEGRSLLIAETLPLRAANGAVLNGLPNRTGADEAPYDCSGDVTLHYDPSGLDTEGIVRLPSGEFWLAEEYGPSLVRVSAIGVVKERVVPRESGIATSAYPVRESLPLVYNRRVQNRGFESLAVSGDHRSLFTVPQGPLANPLPATAKTSRIARILEADARSGDPIAEYVLVLEEASTFKTAAQSDIKISGMVWVAPGRLLIDQRTDLTAQIYEMDLRGATNILGSRWDNGARPTLEELSPSSLISNGLIPAKTRLIADLGAIVPNLPGKIEGLALDDDKTIVVGNDNEYAFDGCDAAQNVIPVHRPSELLFIRFDRRLR